LRGHNETIAQRLERDLAAFQRPLPPAYDACEKVATRVSSLSLVRYRLNDYSVPTTYGHRDVLVRGYVHDVVISCGAEVIARHPRSYERHDLHIRSAALPGVDRTEDQRASIRRRRWAGWRVAGRVHDTPASSGSPDGQAGQARVRAGSAIDGSVPSRRRRCRGAPTPSRRGAIGFDAVKHLILCHIERRPPRLDMTIYPYLPRAQVTMTSARTYMSLLTGASS